MGRPVHLDRRAAAAAAVALALSAAPRRAHAYDEDSAAVQANTGLHFGLGPVLLVPMDGGPLGGGLRFDLRYGIGAAPVILAPGARVAGYFISGRLVALATPTFRVTLPLGPLAPFIHGGVGLGWLTNPSERGLALLAGGGLMVHLGRFLAIGAELTYETIRDTELEAVAVGPSIAIGL